MNETVWKCACGKVSRIDTDNPNIGNCTCGLPFPSLYCQECESFICDCKDKNEIVKLKAKIEDLKQEAIDIETEYELELTRLKKENEVSKRSKDAFHKAGSEYMERALEAEKENEELKEQIQMLLQEME